MQTQVSYSDFLVRSTQNLGSYNIQVPSIAIEAPERTSGRDFGTVFEHEVAHKFLTELSELGFVLLLENTFERVNVGKQSSLTDLLQPIFADFRFHQECFATNIEIVAALETGLDPILILSGYPPLYREAFDALREIHPLLINHVHEARLYILNIGLHTLGIPIFGILRNSTEYIKSAISIKIKEGEFDLSKRLSLSISSFKEAFSEFDSAEENIQKHNRKFALDFRVVSSTSLQELYDNLGNVKLVGDDLREEIKTRISGYAHPIGAEVNELWERVKTNGLIATSMHFNHRFVAPNADGVSMDVLRTLGTDATFAYLNITENTHNFDIQHGGFVIPRGKALVLLHAYSNPLISTEFTNPDDYILRSTRYKDAAYSFVDRENFSSELFEFFTKSNFLIVGYEISFNFATTAFIGKSVSDYKELKLILTTPYLRLRDLVQTVNELSQLGTQYSAHFVYLDDNGSVFFCLRSTENSGWMFVAPFPLLAAPMAVSHIESKDCNVRLCKNNAEFDLDTEMEKALVTFMAHYTFWGW